MAKAVMLQGTGSNVGKSLLVAGLARAFAHRGLRVAPFKPQNMSNNAAVAADGGEIGRAQALQARAANRDALSHMNPILLKPESTTGAQVVVQGQRVGTMRAADFRSARARFLPAVLESFQHLATNADLLLIEGAGSPAEVNLRTGDIANMGFAQAANVPVVLVGDIDRGGVIAQLVGTKAVLNAKDAERIKGFIVNKFRGEPSLFDEGRKIISHHTGWRDLGLIPWFDNAWQLPAEDLLDLAGRKRTNAKLHIAVPRLARLANFDDLDPLAAEPDVSLEIIEPGQALPGNADLVVLPGSKSTISDLKQFRAQGWDIDLTAHLRRGGHVLGICGGYQMLGTSLADPQGIEGTPVAHVEGLDHLALHTTMATQKRLGQVHTRTRPEGLPVHGYEIHMGRSEGPDCARAWLDMAQNGTSAASADGRIMGCYVHGLFASDSFRHSFLSRFNAGAQIAYEHSLDSALNALATHLETHCNLDALLALATPPNPAA